ncbi:MAG: hypothetical protein ACYCTW_03330 [Sulfuricella sp.]
MNIYLNRNHVGWVERSFAKPNKPKQQNLFLKFGFVGFRDEAAQPNLHNCASAVKVWNET